MKKMASIFGMEKKKVINLNRYSKAYKRVFYHQNYIFYNVQKESLVTHEK
jgi:hypothetical protein